MHFPVPVRKYFVIVSVMTVVGTRMIISLSSILLHSCQLWITLLDTVNGTISLCTNKDIEWETLILCCYTCADSSAWTDFIRWISRGWRKVKMVSVDYTNSKPGPRSIWLHWGGGLHQRGGRGGFIPPMILARGGYPPPIKLQNSVFLMGILVKSFKKVFRRQIPFFSKFVSPHIPPINFFLAENLGGGGNATELMMFIQIRFNMIILF